jgi:hypothetical protein
VVDALARVLRGESCVLIGHGAARS